MIHSRLFTLQYTLYFLSRSRPHTVHMHSAYYRYTLHTTYIHFTKLYSFWRSSLQAYSAQLYYYTLHYMLYSIHFTLCTTQCAEKCNIVDIYTLYCTILPLNCTMIYILHLQYTFYTLHCYPRNCTLLLPPFKIRPAETSQGVNQSVCWRQIWLRPKSTKILILKILRSLCSLL